MKVLSVCYDDYANFAYANTESLKSVGVDAAGAKLIKHPFGYQNELPVVSLEQMRIEIEKADIVQIMHSDITVLRICKELNKKCVVYHTGSLYRSRQDYMKELFNPMVAMSFTDQCEFIGTGIKNEQYVAVAIDTSVIKPVSKKIEKPYVIAHYPSNHAVKGTDDIIRMMENVPNDGSFVFKCDIAKVTHQEQLQRIAECDIYIEMFKLELQGHPYGCWGVTAFEAAAMGKIVITNNIHLKAYEDVYGEANMMIANTEHEFFDSVKDCIDLAPKEFQSYSQDAVAWAEHHHSYRAAGEHIKGILEKL